MIDAEAYIPHSGEMVLIDKIVSSGDGWIECLIQVKDSIDFSRIDGSIPSWIGIEYMAQTIAAYAGVEAERNNKKVQPGFLLGTRSYDASHSSFEIDDRLTVRAEVLFQNDELASFSCTVSNTDERIASAKINVYQPEDFEMAIEDVK